MLFVMFPSYLFINASQTIETLTNIMPKRSFSMRVLVSPAWKDVMTRKSQLTTHACIILPFAVVSFGLGYFASSRRRKTIAEHGREISNETDGDVEQVQTPHPAWTPGQKQPPPQGLDKGTNALLVTVRTSCTESVHARGHPRSCTSTNLTSILELQTTHCQDDTPSRIMHLKYINSKRTHGRELLVRVHTYHGHAFEPVSRIARSHATCIVRYAQRCPIPAVFCNYLCHRSCSGGPTRLQELLCSHYQLG